MNDGYLKIDSSNCSQGLKGEIELVGAKNAVLVTIASLLLTSGRSILYNVPVLADVYEMIDLLRHLGAVIFFDTEKHQLMVDTTLVHSWTVSNGMMQKTRASFLIMGPLLARFGKARIGFPGGDAIGKRPVDYHLKNFKKMGVAIHDENDFLCAEVTTLTGTRIILEYPSVGATENIIMAATRARGTTHIINAACEPEVFDLIVALKKMGARIDVQAPATIIIEGVEQLYSIEHTIMFDRLEAGSLLMAAAITGGEIYLPQAHRDHLDIVLLKLQEMGHFITTSSDGVGIHLKATRSPQAVSFKTGPFPAFPTDLQAPMMALQCVAHGTGVIEETVFEDRFHHAHELKKMGAAISIEHNRAIVMGVNNLFGTQVVASDIRASMALVIAGLVAQGTTAVSGVHHWKRGYENGEKKLQRLGAAISLHEIDHFSARPEFFCPQKSIEGYKNK